jgi:hypothetical protein
MKNTVKTIKVNLIKAAVTVKMVLLNRRGEGALDTVISILISVVLGALLLAGLYAIFGQTIMPSVAQKIKDMFNYAG